MFNDPFKKMDLNFGDENKNEPSDKVPELSPNNPAHTQEMVLPKDPISLLDQKSKDTDEITLEGSINNTVETKVEEKPTTPPIQQEVSNIPEFKVNVEEQVKPKTVNTISLENEDDLDRVKFETQLNKQIESNKSENTNLNPTSNLNSGDFSMNENLSAGNYNHTMDKTLEFLIQNDSSATPEVEVEKKQTKKQKEKIAKKHRLLSFLWVFIAVLSIIFGADAIITFAGNISDVIEKQNNDESIFKPVIQSILSSGEALLFSFFIIFSMIKYSFNHKVWIKWWDETEPERIKVAITKEKEDNTRFLTRINALGLYYTHVPKDAKSDAELLSQLRSENKILSQMIDKEEQRRKEEKKTSSEKK